MCLICRAPEHEAPDLIGFNDGGPTGAGGSHCYFKRQPATPDEIDRAINAMCVACCGALRYGGHDSAIINRLCSVGVDSDCIDVLDRNGL